MAQSWFTVFGIQFDPSDPGIVDPDPDHSKGMQPKMNSPKTTWIMVHGNETDECSTSLDSLVSLV